MSATDKTELHTTTGAVIEVYRNRAIVELDVKPQEVGSKPQCKGCGLCSCGGAAGNARVELRASVPEELSLAKGDRVEIRIRLVSPGRAALLLYGLPLFAFLACSIGGWFISHSEMISATSGFSALIAAYLVILLVDRGRGPSARISRKI